MTNIKNEKQKLSIVISGWPAVGKTTIATELAKEFRLEIYNGGDILKMLAGEHGYSISGKDWWDTEDAKNIINLRDEDNIKIYHKTYGLNFGEDLTVFDFALNTDLMSLDALIIISKDIVKNLII